MRAEWLIFVQMPWDWSIMKLSRSFVERRFILDSGARVDARQKPYFTVRKEKIEYFRKSTCACAAFWAYTLLPVNYRFKIKESRWLLICELWCLPKPSHCVSVPWKAEGSKSWASKTAKMLYFTKKLLIIADQLQYFSKITAKLLFSKASISSLHLFRVLISCGMVLKDIKVHKSTLIYFP